MTCFRLASLVCALLFLAGCAGNAGAPSMFLLDTDTLPVDSARVATPVVVIDTVTLAPYLDESSIVYQTEPHRVVMANNNRWASPLAAQLTDGLYSALRSTVDQAAIQRSGRDAPAGAAHLVTRIDQFMGHYDGQAHIAGEWQLVDHDAAVLASGRIQQQIALQDDGYAALVDALSRGWRAAAAGIAPELTAAVAHY